MYRNAAEVEFDPEIQLAKAKKAIENYLNVRANAAWVGV